MINKNGFTLIELLLAMSIIGILFGLTTINLLGAYRSTSVATSEEMLIADLKSQQAKAMNGTDSGGSFGVHFSIPADNTYTLFQGPSFDSTSLTNSPVSVSDSISFSGSDVVFLPVTGEVYDFDATPPTITVVDTTGGSGPKTIQLNRYGVVIQD